MKKIVLTLFAVALMSYSFAQELAIKTASTLVAKTESAAFNWLATEHDFGKVKQGVPVTHEFTFTNKGSMPLVISTVQASCGCTVASYTKEPIAPGGEGYVKATYNAANPGQFTKTVTVNANTEGGVARLIIKGEVVQ